jgi:hypothetical protein
MFFMKALQINRWSLLGLLCAGRMTAATPAVPAGLQLSPEQQAAIQEVPDQPGLPRVLLIGDSISIAYNLAVRAELAGKANVHRPGENCGSTFEGLEKLDGWLGAGPWAVIHFNFGLHDLKYLDAQGTYVTPDKGKQVAPPDQYEKNLRALVRRLQKTGAKLIFATTTPVPSGTSGRVEHGELPYNEVAVRVMKEAGVAVDDLHAFVVPRQAELQLPNNVHFTPAGSVALAHQVAVSILP